MKITFLDSDPSRPYLKRMFRTLILLLLCNLISPYLFAQIKVEKVYVLGTVHGKHLDRKWAYSLSTLKAWIKDIRPDLICAEINPEHIPLKLTGFYPPENAVIKEAALEIGARFEPTDWRGYNPGMVEAEKAMNAEEKKRFDSAHDQLLTLIPLGNSGVIEYLHSDAQPLIRKAHEVRMREGTEVADGYWLARNQRVVKNCMRRAQDLKSRVVLFTYGIEHKYILEDYLQSMYSLKSASLPAAPKVNAEPVSPSVLKTWKTHLDELRKIMKSPSSSADLKYMIDDSKRISELQKFIESQGQAN